MIFHFGHMFMDQGIGGRFDPVPWTMKNFKDVFKIWDDAFLEKGWGSIFLGNHDFARMVSRWGDDKQYWEKSSKLLCTLLLTMRGTPFIFQGDEIGMTNIKLESPEESKDIETQNGWHRALARGLSSSQFMEIANYSGRDNARTPVQWEDSAHAGFTSGLPWMRVNDNKNRINVASQMQDSESILSYFKQMIQLRKNNPVLTYGAYLPVDTQHEKLFIYYRTLEEEKYLVLLNFSSENIILPHYLLNKNSRCMIDNYPTMNHSNSIRPWEAVVYKL